MMKIKSVAGLTCYVKNLKKTVKFYETFGFETRKNETNHATLYSNWFWIDLLAIGKTDRTEFTNGTDLGNKGAGIFLYIPSDL